MPYDHVSAPHLAPESVLSLSQESAEGPAAKEQYAAISRKNIELLYLRRSLLEALVDSPDFERVVLGGFVRIKTQAIDNPAKAAYRLVPVVGKERLHHGVCFKPSSSFKGARGDICIPRERSKCPLKPGI